MVKKIIYALIKFNKFTSLIEIIRTVGNQGWKFLNGIRASSLIGVLKDLQW
jgi:hypothetical protein